MPNVIIPPWHQSSPDWKYDPMVAREAAEAKDPVEAAQQDWDLLDWEQLDPIARRRKMKNKPFDEELDRPAHHDPNFELLEQRAYIERVTRRPQEWVEESLKLYEKNCVAALPQHLPGQARWAGKEVEEQRLVNILHPCAVMRKLRGAGVDARDHENANARIWLNDWSSLGLVGVNAWCRPQEMENEEAYLMMLRDARSSAQADIVTRNWIACRTRQKVVRTLTSLQEPYGPEWSLMHYNEHAVATKERYRGWRTAMLVLIAAEVLTEDEVDRAFGPPVGEAAAWYRMQLQVYRQLRMGRQPNGKG